MYSFTPKPRLWFANARCHMNIHLRLGALLVVCLLLDLTQLSGQQFTTALINGGDSLGIELQFDTYIEQGIVDSTYFTLEKLDLGETGYAEFTLLNIKPTDHLRISLQTADASIFYRYIFANGAVSSERNGSSARGVPTSPNANTFRLERCADAVTLSYQGGIPTRIENNVGDSLVLRVDVVNAEAVEVQLLFTPAAMNCAKCTERSGTALLSGRSQFTGYETTSTGTRLSIQSEQAITTGTTFELTEAQYQNGEWTSNLGAADFPVQRITYTGSGTIAANTDVCFRLPNSGGGDALLATDFIVDGVDRTADFCVMNISPVGNPFIEISSTNEATSVFLTQGAWKFTPDYGQFFGRVLTGWQVQGDWYTGGGSPAAGQSEPPPALECQPPADPVGAPDCGVISSSLVHADDGIRIFPNPFDACFQIELANPTPEEVTIQLLDGTGRAVGVAQRHVVSGANFNLQLCPPPGRGMYFVRLRRGTQTIVRRVVQTIPAAGLPAPARQ